MDILVTFAAAAVGVFGGVVTTLITTRADARKEKSDAQFTEAARPTIADDGRIVAQVVLIDVA